MTLALIIVVVLVVVLAVAVVLLYNNLVTLRNRVDNAWAQVDVQIQRRLDLIPNLVETVKGYAAHESGTLGAVTQARSACISAATPSGRMEADNLLSNTLKSLFAVAEAYPELKADANFRELQAQITETEDKISYMRQSYNDCVMKYNTGIQTFPGNVVAGMFHFEERTHFDANEAAAAAPVVDFGQGNAAAAPQVNFTAAPVSTSPRSTQSTYAQYRQPGSAQPGGEPKK